LDTARNSLPSRPTIPLSAFPPTPLTQGSPTSSICPSDEFHLTPPIARLTRPRSMAWVRPAFFQTPVNLPPFLVAFNLSPLCGRKRFPGPLSPKGLSTLVDIPCSSGHPLTHWLSTLHVYSQIFSSTIRRRSQRTLPPQVFLFSLPPSFPHSNRVNLHFAFIHRVTWTFSFRAVISLSHLIQSSPPVFSPPPKVTSYFLCFPQTFI